MATREQGTHERFLQQTREAVLRDAGDRIDAEAAARIEHAKLVYGVGNGSYRGVCHFKAWQNGVGQVDVVEVAATAEESWVQLAGTTVHELGHVLAGWEAGHGKDWKAAVEQLGLRRPVAAGQTYQLAQFTPALREAVYHIAQDLEDGRPEFRTFGLGIGVLVMPRPCSAGTGTRGGKSRGKGSGSRLRLWECECERPVKVRVASDDFQAHCDRCDAAFTKKEKVRVPSDEFDDEFERE